MRIVSLLLLVACTPTDSGDPVDSDADTDTDSDSDTDTDTDTDSDSDSDTGADTGDTGNDTGDTGNDTGDTDLDMDFVENGPGAGVFFFTDALYLGSTNDCEVNSNPYSLVVWESITLSNVNPGPQLFDEQATASENQIVNCTYHLEGDFWCDGTSRGMDLSSYGLDAAMSWSLVMAGTFVETTADVDGTAHTFSQRWAADLEFSFTMTCAGADCDQAEGMAGINTPCETIGTVTAVNYDDPTLVKAE